MAQKLITFAVPCYNSAAYMRHCIETLLSAGEQAEIILVDDGSTKDDTPAICDEYAAKYPTIVKAIHQENGGHGEGVNQGIRNATGLYYKVVDSDDWLDEAASQQGYQELVEYYTVWAHQIKTPIAAMRLLLQDADTDEQRALLEQVQSVEQYVEMVLGYLRLESPSSDYVIRNYALDDIVRQAVRKYASQFIRRRLRLEYTPLNVSVITDEKWLLFVIEQVLSNALKYTRSGSVSIMLEAPKTLCIRDTGIGIASEDLPRVFEKGFTGCNGRTDKRATGIGLYLCRRILEKLGHTIAITSTVGEGTTVRICLQQDALEVE